jgi:hypothetical protein
VKKKISKPRKQVPAVPQSERQPAKPSLELREAKQRTNEPTAVSSGFLGKAWWQGVAGIAQIIAAVVSMIAVWQVASMAFESDRVRREAARPKWLVNGWDPVDNEHGRGFRIGLVNAGGAAVTVRDVGFRIAVRGCWVVQPAFPYSVPVGAATAITVTCSAETEFRGELLLAASTQAGEITVHAIHASVMSKVPRDAIVGGGVDGEANLIAATDAVENATYLRPEGNLAP